jgi:surfeit locus 1 family protein
MVTGERGDWGVVELTRSGLLAALAILVVAAVCVRLGFWQLDRRDQRMERNAAVAERMAAAPARIASTPTDTAGLLHRSATAHGTYDHARTVVLGGRSHRGVPGVYVLTPLHLEGGAILINRGWIPSPDAATIDLAGVSRPAQAEVAGVLIPFPDVPPTATGDTFRTRWFRLDGEAIRAQYPYGVAPLYLQETGPRTVVAPAAGTLDPIPLDPPALDAGPHLSYAVQWFSFAAIFLIGGLVLALRRGGGRARARG